MALTALRARLRDKTIVLCHGAFDLIHIGHVIHFEEAASLGNVLVVTITADNYITKKRSVSFTEEYRARQVAAVRPGEFDLLHWINTWVFQSKQNGTLARIYEKWMGIPLVDLPTL